MKRKWFLLVLAFCLPGFGNLACNLEKTIPVTETPPPTAESSGYSFSGAGTDTWIWEGGKYTCDSQDSMELTIDKNNNAKLKVRGVCLSLSDVGGPGIHESGKCDQGGPDVTCGMTVYGYYNPDDQRVTFDYCNNYYVANGSGSAKLVPIPGSTTEMQVSGTATCDLSGHDEDHELKFTLP
jgi:hypothetical protein